MKNYLKTQRNQFGQTIGFSLEENVTASPVQGNIFGQYVQLVDVADGITDQAAGQLWEAHKPARPTAPKPHPAHPQKPPLPLRQLSSPRPAKI
jgi:hypothetical protein